jgi:hypothetical protein
VVTLSLPRGGRFQGLELDEELARRRVAPWCGLVVVDIRNGDVVEWLRLGEQFGELFDVAVVPMTRCAVAIAANNPILHDAITFETEFAPLVQVANPARRAMAAAAPERRSAS